MMPYPVSRFRYTLMPVTKTAVVMHFVLFLLGMVACAFSETCPEAEEMMPCICEELEDSGNILVSCADEGDGLKLKDLRQPLKSLAGKNDVEIELTEIDLGTVPSNFFAGVGIKRLDIGHCELESLTDDEGQAPLAGLEDTLEELVVLGSFTENDGLTKLKIGHLRKLKELDLTFNEITELSDDWFERGPTSLEYLSLESNGIERIGSRAFADLSGLKDLSVTGNRFGPVERSMLPSSGNNMERLELDNNALTYIPKDLFSGMPSLSSISLRNNGVARLEKDTWEPILEQLDVIYLEGNPLECDSHMNWLFNIRVTSAVYGTCSYPREKDGTRLQDFIDNKGQ